MTEYKVTSQNNLPGDKYDAEVGSKTKMFKPVLKSKSYRLPKKGIHTVSDVEIEQA